MKFLDDDILFDAKYDRYFEFTEHDYDPRGEYAIRVDQLDDRLALLAQARMDQLASCAADLNLPFERGRALPADLSDVESRDGSGVVGLYCSGTYNEPVVLLDLAAIEAGTDWADMEVIRTVDHEVRHAAQEADDQGDGVWADEDDAEIGFDLPFPDGF